MKERILNILLGVSVSVLFGVVVFFPNVRPNDQLPIESTRQVIFTCTVKSNIEGVITLNDDCKITVVK